MLGRFMGGAIRFAAAGPEMAIGEGIETTLSYMQVSGIPSWAAICTSGMRSIVLPPLPMAAVVHLLVDLDPAGEEAAKAAADRLSREGRAVKLARPTTGKDFNDALRGGADAR
jgi:putative DNA primase/helicase